MKRLPLVFAVFVIMFATAVGQALALTIDNIGTTEVPDGTTSSWYYTGSNPTFSGTAAPSATVTVKIDEASFTTTANSSGTWTYTPTTLNESVSYLIELISGTDSISFDLDITTSDTDTDTTSTTTTSSTSSSSSATSLSSSKGGTMSGSVSLPKTLPQSGSLQETIGVIAAGLVLMVGGMLFYWKVVPRLLFTDDQEDSHQ